MCRIYAFASRALSGLIPRAFCGVGLLLLSLGVAGAADLEDIHQLRDSGFLGLAIRTLDRYQPDVSADPDGWLRWERERFNLYEHSGQREQLLQRIREFQDKLPDRHARTLMFHGVSAHLALEDGAGARALLSDLLLGHRGELGAAQESYARRLLVTACLYENKPREALVALQHFEQSSGEDVNAGPALEQWRQQQAQVYLLNDDLPHAEEIIAAEDDAKGHYSPLRLLIHLRSGRLAPQQAIVLSQEQLAREGIAAGGYQAVIAEASARLGERLAQVGALERAMILPLGAARGIYHADATHLWAAYRQLRPALAPLVNIAEDADDQQWIKTAEALSRPKLQVKWQREHRSALVGAADVARYIYAMLASSRSADAFRDLAHGRMVLSLMQREQGFALVKALYLNESAFPQAADVPEGVRHIMIGEAIRQADTPLASRLMRGLQQAPPGVAKLDWQLRQARVHVMAGNPQQSVEVILGLLKDVHRYNNDELDRLIQVLFDLQAIGEHRTVIPLLETVFTRAGDDQRRRELLYWIADSMAQLKEYDEAARYYLKSATLLDPAAMDMWARSARFQAAEMLTQAGLPGDARKIYQELLAVATDPVQRKHLQRNIQQLAYRHQ